MKFTDLINTANSNLGKSKLRTFLTGFTIVVGAFTLSMALGLTGGVSAYIKSQLGTFQDVNLYRVVKSGADGGGASFSTAPKEYNPEKKTANGTDFANFILGPEDISKISSVSGVKNVRLPYSFNTEFAQGSQISKWDSQVGSIVPELPIDVIEGQSSIDENDQTSAAISAKLVEPFFGNISSKDAIGREFSIFYPDITGKLIEKRLKVASVITPNVFASPINISEGLAKTLALEQKGPTFDRFQQIFISKQDNLSDSALKENFKKLNYEAGSLKDLNDQLNKIVSIIQGGLILFSGIAIFAALIGVVNTLYMSVLERTKEIGLYRALGSSRRGIFALFSFEALAIAFWGSAAGILISYLIQQVINKIAANSFLKGVDGYKLFNIKFGQIITVIGTIMFVTFIFSLFPSRKAAKLDPIKALKYE